jgi:hypothetical protein
MPLLYGALRLPQLPPLPTGSPTGTPPLPPALAGAKASLPPALLLPRPPPAEAHTGLPELLLPGSRAAAAAAAAAASLEGRGQP